MITLALIRAVNEVRPISVFALNLVTGAGLGLAIDYSLLLVSRYREELVRHGPGVAALRATLETAGRTVAFSAVTVAAAFASLLVFPLGFLRSMAIGGLIVAPLAGLVALTVLPALFALLGTRVNALAPARWQRAAERAARPDERGGWYRFAHWVMRHPAADRGRLRDRPDRARPAVPERAVHRRRRERAAAERARARGGGRAAPHFPPGADSPIHIAASVADPAATLAAIRRLPGIAAVPPPQRLGARLWEIEVIPRGSAMSGSAKTLVRAIRRRARRRGRGADGLVPRHGCEPRSPPAASRSACSRSSPSACSIAVTRSLVLPLKALLMNVLGLSAAFGLLVLIFQDGRLEGLLNYHSQGALELTQPALLFAIAFGLATDYGVFLLSRIKEAHDDGLENREAVALGLERTGRVVTSAALLFCVAVGAFATSSIVIVKEVGIGIALAVAIDATLVRALLVPSLMALLGDWNWWPDRRRG